MTTTDLADLRAQVQRLELETVIKMMTVTKHYPTVYFRFDLFDGRQITAAVDEKEMQQLSGYELLMHAFPLRLTGLRVSVEQSRWPVPEKMYLYHLSGIPRFDDETEALLRMSDAAPTDQ